MYTQLQTCSSPGNIFVRCLLPPLGGVSIHLGLGLLWKSSQLLDSPAQAPILPPVEGQQQPVGILACGCVHGYSGRLRWQPCPGHIERNFWTTAAISPKKPYTQSANDYSTQEKMHQGDSESIPHGPTLASCDTPRWKSKSRHSWGLEWQTQMLGLLPVVKVPKKPIKCFTMFSCDCSCLFSWISLTEGEAGVSQCNQKVNNIMFGN